MNSAALIVLAVAGALAVWLLRGRPLLAPAAAIAGLTLSLVAIGLQRPGASFVVGGLAVVVTDYSRLALAVASASFLVLALLDVASTAGTPGGEAAAAPTRAGEAAPAARGGSGTPVSGADGLVTSAKQRRPRAARAAVPDAGASTAAGATPGGTAPERPAGGSAWTPAPIGAVLLVALAFLSVGLPTADPAVYRYLPNAAGPEISLLLLTAAGILVLPAGLRGTEDLGSLRTSVRELRLIGAAGGLALVGAAWLALLGAHALPDPQASAAGLGLIGLAVVLRVGAVPLHGVRARLGTTLPGPLVPVVAVWLPAGFVLAALAWSQAALTPLGLAAPREASAALALLAFVSLATGSLAATLQEDLRRLVIYSVIGDAGLALLALAAGTSASAPAGRAWLVLYALGKSALVAWAIAVRRAYGTDVLDDLQGWARRAPLLGLGLLAVAVGSVGLPGWAAFDVRQRLIQNALDGAWPWTPLLVGAAWLGVLPYLRLALLGVRAPTSTIRSAEGEWPMLRGDRARAQASGAPRGIPPWLAPPLAVAMQSAPTLAASLALALGLLLLALGAGGALTAAAAGAG